MASFGKFIFNSKGGFFAPKALIVLLLLAVAIPITALQLNNGTNFLGQAVGISQIYNVSTSADTYVDDNYENKNYGKATILKVDGSPERISFIKFRVPNLSDAITSAKLQLKLSGDTNSDKKVYSIESSKWSETGMTYKNKPALRSVIGTISAGKTGEIKTVDLLQFVTGKAGKTISIAIYSDTSDGVIYLSKESGSEGPKLIIQITKTILDDTTSPTTTITAPVSGQVVSGTTLVDASASDNSGVVKVEFYIDGTMNSTDSLAPYNYSWNTTTVVNGNHTLQTKAYDAASNMGVSSIVSLSVSNVLPVPPLPTPVPDPDPVPVGSGIWISPQEIAQLPMSGTMWTIVKNVADSNLGTANLADQTNRHSIETYAVALVAARTGLDSYKTKAVNEIVKAIGTENNPDADGSCILGPSGGADTLAMGRNVMGYAVAADLLNLRPGGYDPSGNGTKIYNWLKKIQTRENCMPHGGKLSTQTLAEAHEEATSNGNALNGGSRIAVSGYLRDKADLDRAWLTYRKYTGDPTMPIDMRNNSYAQTWIYDTSKVVGINPKGTSKVYNGQSYSIDGVVVNDQGRGGDFAMPPGYTQYPWEGLQGAFAQAVILDRLDYKDAAGNDAWRTNDSALLRAVEYQWMLQQTYGGSWFDSSRAAWVKHLANKFYGKSYPVASRADSRNIDYTQWTHPL